MSDVDPLAPATVVPNGIPPLLAESFDHGQVTEVRHTVASRAESSGLTGTRLDDFVLAVNELITNAVRHGGGRGWLRLWSTRGTLYCMVSDTGAGIDVDRLDDRRRPAPEIAGGWGLWLARELSDEMLVRSGPDGTTVRISASLGGPEPGRLAG
ncbi:ATP-binding protein [Plantactinospora soyae]|uniref:Anti-sigma regulatory factor (Ser/Thr protein kinase) n=1 Tax=Plantactinospora soyae TaxID=1544732 RepID=A0A927M5S7_9ACTN|nr:ATP-binding protein [Plantactinospora soyae]MBE1487146.1 anti-sigma regulatory factor (Ser/Thr protein kinase) [Plantactinospora soyae]